jgi:AcrR family transcriptional regulator
MSKGKPASVDEKKNSHLLDTAMEVFMRFGFKKTSMAEVAVAAGLSRQGIYFHYPTKEALFRAMMIHLVRTMREKVATVMAEKGESLEMRLLTAFDVTMGRYVGKMSTDAFDLAEATETLAGDLFETASEDLLTLLATAIDDATLSDHSVGTPKVSSRDRAAAIFAASCGLKHKADTSEEFRREMLVAIRVALAPLKLRKR